MTCYAVGDLQGCLAPLQTLLEQVGFDPSRDQLWSVGDLVNRGPESLACLRFFAELGDSARVVLGNHDLHLLAVAEGIRPLKRGDTLQAILDAPDAAELLHWLRHRPLCFYDADRDVALVHAGIAPFWSMSEALDHAREVQSQLRGTGWRELLAGMYGDEPNRWDEQLAGLPRWRLIINYFTRMRFCRSDGSLDLGCKAAPADAPPGLVPWFDLPLRAAAPHRIVFGHWAALMGRTSRDDVIGLDTGCVWGEHLTLLDLDNGLTYTCACTAS